MNKRINSYALIFSATVLLSCSSDFLDVSPKGSSDAVTLSTSEAGVDKVLIGAYSMLDGVSSQGFGWESASSNWVFGSVRAGEANKGSEAGDQPAINPIQNYTDDASNGFYDVLFKLDFWIS